MEVQEDLDSLINAAITSINTTIQQLQAAAPLLGQRHQLFQDEATRLITASQATLSDTIALLDAEDVDPELAALTTPATAEVHICAICSQQFQPSEPTVPMTNGDFVHIACANQHAAQQQARRERWALAHGIALIGIVLVLGSWSGITLWLLVFTITGAVLHVVLHRRWWYYFRRDVGRWLFLGVRR